MIARLIPLAALAVALPLAAQQAARPVTTPPKDLDAWVEQVMRRFGVPGLALAVVKDGKVVLAKGYGVKRLGEPARVGDRTMFGIASNTKVMTAVALGLLVERKQLEWDAPVVRYLPDFALHDPWVTRELTIRDLLVHRSGLGLGAGDLLWWPATTYDRKEIVRRLRHIEPVTSFRSAYAYDNVLYAVAGEVIEKVDGRPWESFVEQEILARVGMTASTVRDTDKERAGLDIASGHAEVEGRLQPVKPYASDNTNPAGGVNAGAVDMAKWLLVLADSGRLADGTALYSTATARQLWQVVTPIPSGPQPPWLAPLTTNFNGYALGLNMRDYRGRKLATHTGGLPGFTSRVTTVPSERLGVAVLLNAESGAAFDALTWRLVDHFLGVTPPFDWVEGMARRQARADSLVAAQRAAAAAKRAAESRPSLPLARYAGTYRDRWYGDVAVAEEGGRLVIRFTKTPALVGDLEHWQYDSFVARWRDRELRADAFVTFQLDHTGTVERLRIVPESDAVDFSFDFRDLRLERVP